MCARTQRRATQSLLNAPSKPESSGIGWQLLLRWQTGFDKAAQLVTAAANRFGCRFVATLPLGCCAIVMLGGPKSLGLGACDPTGKRGLKLAEARAKS